MNIDENDDPKTQKYSSNRKSGVKRIKAALLRISHYAWEGQGKEWGIQACGKRTVYPIAEVKTKRGTGVPIPLGLWQGW